MSNPGRRWFETDKEFVPVARGLAREEAPDLFGRCTGCQQAVYLEVLQRSLQVCPLCGVHLPIGGEERLRALVDGPWVAHDEGLGAIDALGFVDSKPYPKRLVEAQKKSGRQDAFLAVSASIHGVEVELGSFDFRFLGGSMGVVVGESITRLYERALARRVPAVVVSASGGARMQEGVLSLMQMAKTCAALGRLQRAGLPYISVLTHPTTGGVAASFAMLGDVILAEPGALIGFAGPRVIKETIGQDLPKGFQTSEYLLENGLIDRIVPRTELRATLGRVLRLLLQQPRWTETREGQG